jgi:hypothetical protein
MVGAVWGLSGRLLARHPPRSNKLYTGNPEFPNQYTFHLVGPGVPKPIYFSSKIIIIIHSQWVKPQRFQF